MKAALLLIAGLLVLAVAAAASAWWWWLRPDFRAAPPAAGTTQRHALHHEGRLRSWRLVLPGGTVPPRALLVVLHGSRQTGDRFRSWTGGRLDELADHHGFAVAYADGVQGHWNDCRRLGDFAAKTLRIDDVGFLRRLIDGTVQDLRIDPARVVMLGYSNGGHMALRFAIEGDRPLQALVMIGASVPADDNFACAGQAVSTPAMLIAGTEDPINPFAGGRVVLLGSDRGAVRSVEASARWLAGDGARLVAARDDAVGTGGLPPMRVIDQLWQGKAMHPVRVLAVEGGGHTVPQPRVRFPRVLGRTALHVDALAQAVEFAGLTQAGAAATPASPAP